MVTKVPGKSADAKEGVDSTSTSNSPSDKTDEATSGRDSVGTICVDFDNPSSHVSTDSTGSEHGGQGQSLAGSQSKHGGQTQTSHKSSSAEEDGKSMVSPVVLRSMITELNKFDNEYLKQKKNKKKSRSKSKQQSAVIQKQQVQSAAESCNTTRLFQRYDMVAPPNKVTPTAFLNTSVNRFKHAGGTSAFQNPREPPRTFAPTGLNDPYNSYSGLQGLPVQNGLDRLDSGDLQRASLDHIASAQLMGVPSPPRPQNAISNLLHGHHQGHSAATSLHQQPFDSLPALSDLLAPYKNHHSPNMAAAAMAQRHLEHSLLNSTQTSPLQPTGMSSSNLFGLPPTSTPASNGTSSNHSICSNDSIKSPNSDIPYPPSPSQHSFPLHSHHSSAFNLNRVFPFPLIADPPAMLSSLRQSDPYRHHPQWPSPTSPLRSQGNQIQSSGTEEPYRPLLISSLSNPYFTPHSATYSLAQTSLSSQPLPWPNPLASHHSSTSYTQL